MTLLDQTVILKAPIDCDVRKIGFILIDEEVESQEAPMDIDFDISPQPATPKTIKNQCTMCSRVLANASNLTRHMRSVHNKEESFDCKICNLNFHTKRQLSYHLHLHTNENLSCDTCGSKEKTKYQMMQHMKKHQGQTSTVIDLV
jgi:Zinc finger, C2H2 type